jgi:hypothetical protein
MKKASLGFLGVVALSSPLLAQVQQVVPTDRDVVAGNGAFLGPLSNAVRRYQLLMDEGELTSLIGQPLTGVTFRLLPSATVPYPAADLTYSDYEIFLGGGVDPSLRSLTFADNRVGPQTQVRDGSLTIPAGSFPVGGSPQPFGADITFDTPFVYTGGDLLLELVHSTSDGTSASNDAMTVTGGSGYGTRFGATWTSNLASLTGSNGNFAILRFTAVPEPASLGLVLGGALLLTFRARRA